MKLCLKTRGDKNACANICEEFPLQARRNERNSSRTGNLSKNVSQFGQPTKKIVH